MLNTIITVMLIAISFAAGMWVDNYYHTRAAREAKDALERQFVRLRVNADADDPCRPYVAPTTDSYGPINMAFMNELKRTGRAKTSFRKSDLAK